MMRMLVTCELRWVTDLSETNRTRKYSACFGGGVLCVYFCGFFTPEPFFCKSFPIALSVTSQRMCLFLLDISVYFWITPVSAIKGIAFLYNLILVF